jgi:molybdate transport system substrate-binding protein
MKAVALAALGTIASTLMMTGIAHAASIRVLCSSAMRGAFDQIAPEFERTTGHKLVTQYALPPILIAKVDAGEPFDVIMLSLDVAGLIKQGKVVASSRTVLGGTAVGVAIHAGAPKPDFSTVEAFKHMLLNAKSFSTSGEGSSGRYIAALVERLGIADQVKPKIKSGGPGRSGEMLSHGEVDFVVSGLPPLVGVPNIEWLGLIPAEINSWVVFTGGVGAQAKEPDAGRALLAYLTTPAAFEVFKSKGFDKAP